MMKLRSLIPAKTFDDNCSCGGKGCEKCNSGTFLSLDNCSCGGQGCEKCKGSTFLSLDNCSCGGQGCEKCKSGGTFLSGNPFSGFAATPDVGSGLN